MNNLKFGVLACGLLGLIGCFLPFITFGSESFSFFKMREGDAAQVYMTMAGYVAALVAGAMAAAKPPMQRWQGIVAIVGFAWVLFKTREPGPIKMITDGAIGAKLMALGAIVGVIVAVLAVAKPETAK